MDRSLAFRHHLVALRKKLSSRLTLLRRPKDSGWGASAKTLHTVSLSVVYSTVEYCTTVQQNDALRIVNGCLRSTPTDYLPILSGIHPAELRQQRASLSLAYFVDL